MNCPHCQKELPASQAEANCPFCGGRLFEKLHGPMFLLFLLGPAILTLISVPLFPDALGPNGSVPIYIGLWGGGAGGVGCGVLLGRRIGRTLGTQIALGLLFAAIMAVVCITLCLVGCSAGGFIKCI
jgi:DNA-directed RNA polymerase subunit RPC12/RpoP